MGNLDRFAESAKKELASTIKGYLNYSTPEDRKKTDQNLRKFLLAKLDSANRRLPEFEKQMQGKTDKTISEAFKRVVSGLSMLLNSLKNPCYVDQAFFGKTNLQSEILSQLYDHDKQLLEQVGIFEDEFKQLDTNEKNQELTEFLNHLYDLTDGLNQILTEREFLFMGD